MVTQAVAPAEELPPAAHRARAIVLPAPGGPVTVVTGPRAPWAMRAWMRGRGMSHSGTPGTVTLDARSGSPGPAGCRAGPAVTGMATLVTIVTASASGRSPVCPVGPGGLARLIAVFARTRVTGHHPLAISPG